MKEKISEVCVKIFSVGCGIVLGLSLLCAIGFIVAFFIGPATAEQLCQFIQKQCIPNITLFSMILYTIGMVRMYVRGEQAFTINDKD